IYSSAIFGIITVFVALWGVPFMQKIHHVSLSRATLLCNIVFIGVAVGAPILGWLDGRLRDRRFIMVGAAILAAFLLCVLIFDTQLSMFGIGAVMFLLGIAASSYVLNFVIANEVSSSHTRSTAIGFTNMFSVVSAPIFQPLIGLVLYLLSNHPNQTNFDAYSVVHFQEALLMIPIFVVIAAVLALWLPKRTISELVLTSDSTDA
ncbi:MAG: MFS transporter, partial [Coxiellaceae bacterium]|nr:MFS transporter [Coxiellaceae bacterium]